MFLISAVCVAVREGFSSIFFDTKALKIFLIDALYHGYGSMIIDSRKPIGMMYKYRLVNKK